MGAMLLLIVAFQFSHSKQGLNRLGLASIALGIAVIGISYYQHRRELNQLTGTIRQSSVEVMSCRQCNDYLWLWYL
jgi:hypothetical protein